jgi:hypothetical protein
MISLTDAQKYSLEIFDTRGALVNHLDMQGSTTMAIPTGKTSGG